MNKPIAIREVSLAVHNAYQLLLNDELELFIETFKNIDVNVAKNADDNLVLLKLIADVEALSALVKLKNADISKKILSTRKQIQAIVRYNPSG